MQVFGSQECGKFSRMQNWIVFRCKNKASWRIAGCRKFSDCASFLIQNVTQLETRWKVFFSGLVFAALQCYQLRIWHLLTSSCALCLIQNVKRRISQQMKQHFWWGFCSLWTQWQTTPGDTCVEIPSATACRRWQLGRTQSYVKAKKLISMQSTWNAGGSRIIRIWTIRIPR